MKSNEMNSNFGHHSKKSCQMEGVNHDVYKRRSKTEEGDTSYLSTKFQKLAVILEKVCMLFGSGEMKTKFFHH